MNSKTFSTEAELMTYLDGVMSKVIESVSDKLLKDFLHHLDETIYSPKPGKYHRYYKNGGFYAGWYIQDDVKKKCREYVKSLVFDGDRLIAPEEDMHNSQMTHGGRDGNDIRDIIAMVLNNPMYNDYYAYNGGAKYLEDSNQGYWDSYISDIEKKCEKWFDNELKKYNIRG